MAVRIPFLEINAPSGRNIVPGLGPALLGVSVTDNEGYESDEAVITVVDKPPFNRPPRKGITYQITYGWQGESRTKTGLYTFEKLRKSGDPESGKTMELVCRAADFLDRMKRVETRHYDDENGFGTAGKIFEKLAQNAGVRAAIDPEIAAIKIPYRLRQQQSDIDFATSLADDIGAIVKPQAGRLVIRKRGLGKSTSRRALPIVKIINDDQYGYDFDLDPRPSHQEVAAPFFDPQKGRSKEATARTRAQLSRLALQHPFASEEEAMLGAMAAGQAYNRFQGSGSLDMAGNIDAVAGAIAELSGYGTDIDEIEWEVASLTDEVTPNGGWLASCELQTREQAETVE